MSGRTPRRPSVAALVWRRSPTLEILIVHPGGPYFRGEDEGAWSLPKGEHEHDRLDPQSLLETALRELHEETGLMVETPALPLGEVRQKGGKRVIAYAFEADSELPAGHLPPQVRIEWPPRSGFELAFPEVDEARFFPVAEALPKLNPAQRDFVARLEEALSGRRPS